jgi:hypothetical protein
MGEIYSGAGTSFDVDEIRLGRGFTFPCFVLRRWKNGRSRHHYYFGWESLSR